MAGQEGLIVITGPTCSGKTGSALRLVRHYPIEVISADSMQVYRYMDIATAKLYIKALLYGLAPAPARSERIRSVLRSLVRERGIGYLERMLFRLDPEAAALIRKNDIVRMVRSLEIILLTGQKASAIFSVHGFRRRRYDARIACILPDRERLFADIDDRTERMMESGLLDETQRLLDMGYGPDLRSMQTLAYKHVIRHFRSECGLDECVRLIKRDTRRFAKRQITWMKAQPDHGCYTSGEAIVETVSQWLEKETRKAV